jgi:hypothetical protein
MGKVLEAHFVSDFFDRKLAGFEQGFGLSGVDRFRLC